MIVIGKEPVLEATLSPATSLIFYGRPGASFGIEYKTNLEATAAWTQLLRVSPPRFFRAREQ